MDKNRVQPLSSRGLFVRVHRRKTIDRGLGHAISIVSGASEEHFVGTSFCDVENWQYGVQGESSPLIPFAAEAGG